MDFKHIIYTRFIYDNLEDFKRRNDLYERFAKPSLERQTKKNFTWLVRINPDHLPFFKPPEGVDYNLVNSPLKLSLVKDIPEKWVVATRFDSDDCLHPDFVQTIQNNLEPKKMMIDTRGYRYHVEKDEAHPMEMYFDKWSFPSPFVTCIDSEHKDSYDGPYSEKHTELQKRYKHTKRIDDHLWIQCVHDSNWLNKPYKTEKIDRKLLWIK